MLPFKAHECVQPLQHLPSNISTRFMGYPAFIMRLDVPEHSFPPSPGGLSRWRLNLLLFEHAQEAQKVGLLLQTLAAQAVADMRAGTLTPANVTASTGAPALSSFLAQIDLPSMPP